MGNNCTKCTEWTSENQVEYGVGEEVNESHEVY